jgi:hypothetical protein
MLHLCYNNKPVNTVQWNKYCLSWEPYKTQKYTIWAERKILVFKADGTYSNHTALKGSY